MSRGLRCCCGTTLCRCMRCLAVCSCAACALPVECLHEIAPDAPFCLGDVRVTPFATPHDAAGSCGYRLDGSAHFLVLHPDLGVVTDTVRAALAGVDCAVIEANHDPELLRTGPYPVYLKRRHRVRPRASVE